MKREIGRKSERRYKKRLFNRNNRQQHTDRQKITDKYTENEY